MAMIAGVHKSRIRRRAEFQKICRSGAYCRLAVTVLLSNVAASYCYANVSVPRQGLIPMPPLAWVALTAIASVVSVFALGAYFRTRQQARSLARSLASLGGEAELTPMPARRQSPLSPVVNSINILIDSVIERRQEMLNVFASNRVLAREINRLFQLLNALPDGFIAIDNAGKIVLANRASAAFLKTPVGEAPGQPVHACVRYPEVLELLSAQGDEGAFHGVRTVELPPDSQQGVGYTAILHTCGFTDDDRPVGQILIFRDISRIKNVEKLQAEFVDSVAHELRTPLTSIRAYAEMLIDGEAKDKQTQDDFFNVIYQETYRLSELIDNLLNISMLESGTASLDVTPVRLKRLIEDALEVVRPQCESKKIRLVSDLPDRLPTMNIDKRLFQVAVMNILGNAVKYTPEGGSVTIATSSHEDEFALHVRDTGIGVPESDLERIFDKFYRSAGAEGIQGSGVGLASARQIVRLHGGEIRVRSRVGEGSEFVIVLPRAVINTTIGE